MARRTRSDWLEAGLDVLASEGMDALTIDRLAQRLGVTKGSFYHHFKSHAVFRDGLLTFWEQWGMDFGRLPSGTAPEALASLDAIVDSSPIGTSHKDPGMAIRFWATRDPAVRIFVERVDARRLAYVAELLTTVLHDRERATFLSRMLYALVLGAGHTIPPAEHGTMLAFYREFKRLLTDEAGLP